MSEPYTHYDANDDHGYDMHFVKEPPEFGNSESLSTPDNVIYIDGMAYVISSYYRGDEETCLAILKLWIPF